MSSSALCHALPPTSIRDVPWPETLFDKAMRCRLAIEDHFDALTAASMSQDDGDGGIPVVRASVVSLVQRLADHLTGFEETAVRILTGIAAATDAREAKMTATRRLLELEQTKQRALGAHRPMKTTTRASDNNNAANSGPILQLAVQRGHVIAQALSDLPVVATNLDHGLDEGSGGDGASTPSVPPGAVVISESKMIGILAELAAAQRHIAALESQVHATATLCEKKNEALSYIRSTLFQEVVLLREALYRVSNNPSYVSSDVLSLLDFIPLFGASRSQAATAAVSDGSSSLDSPSGGSGGGSRRPPTMDALASSGNGMSPAAVAQQIVELKRTHATELTKLNQFHQQFVKAKDQELEKLRYDVEHLRCASQTDLLAKTTTQETLLRDLTRLQAELLSKDKQLVRLNMEVSTLQAHNEGQAQALTGYKDQLSRVTSEIESVMEVKDRELMQKAQLLADLQSKMKSFEAIKQMGNSAAGKLDLLERELLNKDEVMRKAQMEAAEQSEKATSLSTKLRTVTEEKDDQIRSQAAEHAVQVATAYRQVKSLEAEVAQLRQQLLQQRDTASQSINNRRGSVSVGRRQSSAIAAAHRGEGSPTNDSAFGAMVPIAAGSVLASSDAEASSSSPRSPLPAAVSTTAGGSTSTHEVISALTAENFTLKQQLAQVASEKDAMLQSLHTARTMLSVSESRKQLSSAGRRGSNSSVAPAPTSRGGGALGTSVADDIVGSFSPAASVLPMEFAVPIPWDAAGISTTTTSSHPECGAMLNLSGASAATSQAVLTASHNLGVGNANGIKLPPTAAILPPHAVPVPVGASPMAIPNGPAGLPEDLPQQQRSNATDGAAARSTRRKSTTTASSNSVAGSTRGLTTKPGSSVDESLMTAPSSSPSGGAPRTRATLEAAAVVPPRQVSSAASVRSAGTIMPGGGGVGASTTHALPIVQPAPAAASKQLAAEVVALSAERDQLRGRVADLTAAHQQLDDRIRELLSEKDHATHRADDLQREVANLHATIARFQSRYVISAWKGGSAGGGGVTTQKKKSHAGGTVVVANEEATVIGEEAGVAVLPIQPEVGSATQLEERKEVSRHQGDILDGADELLHASSRVIEMEAQLSKLRGELHVTSTTLETRYCVTVLFTLWDLTPQERQAVLSRAATLSKAATQRPHQGDGGDTNPTAPNDKAETGGSFESINLIAADATAAGAISTVQDVSMLMASSAAAARKGHASAVSLPALIRQLADTTTLMDDEAEEQQEVRRSTGVPHATALHLSHGVPLASSCSSSPLPIAVVTAAFSTPIAALGWLRVSVLQQLASVERDLLHHHGLFAPENTKTASEEVGPTAAAARRLRLRCTVGGHASECIVQASQGEATGAAPRLATAVAATLASSQWVRSSSSSCHEEEGVSGTEVAAGVSSPPPAFVEVAISEAFSQGSSDDAGGAGDDGDRLLATSRVTVMTRDDRASSAGTSATSDASVTKTTHLAVHASAIKTFLVEEGAVPPHPSRGPTGGGPNNNNNGKSTPFSFVLFPRSGAAVPPSVPPPVNPAVIHRFVVRHHLWDLPRSEPVATSTRRDRGTVEDDAVVVAAASPPSLQYRWGRLLRRALQSAAPIPVPCAITRRELQWTSEWWWSRRGGGGEAPADGGAASSAAAAGSGTSAAPPRRIAALLAAHDELTESSRRVEAAGDGLHHFLGPSSHPPFPLPTVDSDCQTVPAAGHDVGCQWNGEGCGEYGMSRHPNGGPTSVHLNEQVKNRDMTGGGGATTMVRRGFSAHRRLVHARGETESAMSSPAKPPPPSMVETGVVTPIPGPSNGQQATGGPAKRLASASGRPPLADGRLTSSQPPDVPAASSSLSSSVAAGRPVSGATAVSQQAAGGGGNGPSPAVQVLIDAQNRIIGRLALADRRTGNEEGFVSAYALPEEEEDSARGDRAAEECPTMQLSSAVNHSIRAGSAPPGFRLRRPELAPSSSAAGSGGLSISITSGFSDESKVLFVAPPAGTSPHDARAFAEQLVYEAANRVPTMDQTWLRHTPLLWVGPPAVSAAIRSAAAVEGGPTLPSPPENRCETEGSSTAAPLADLSRVTTGDASGIPPPSADTSNAVPSGLGTLSSTPPLSEGTPHIDRQGVVIDVRGVNVLDASAAASKGGATNLAAMTRTAKEATAATAVRGAKERLDRAVAVSKFLTVFGPDLFRCASPGSPSPNVAPYDPTRTVRPASSTPTVNARKSS